jgi:hypothetical protein
MDIPFYIRRTCSTCRLPCAVRERLLYGRGYQVRWGLVRLSWFVLVSFTSHGVVLCFVLVFHVLVSRSMVQPVVLVLTIYASCMKVNKDETHHARPSALFEGPLSSSPPSSPSHKRAKSWTSEPLNERSLLGRKAPSLNPEDSSSNRHHYRSSRLLCNLFRNEVCLDVQLWRPFFLLLWVVQYRPQGLFPSQSPNRSSLLHLRVVHSLLS